jgi:hypothetical protein
MTPAEIDRLETAIDDAVAAGDIQRAQALVQGYQSAAANRPRFDPLVRTPWFRSNYLAAQVALAASQLQQALGCLTPLLPRIDRLPEVLAARVRLLAAEATARLQRPAEARGFLAEVSGVLLEGQPLLLLRALRIRHWLGDVEQLTVELARCYLALEGRGDSANRALLLCEEGRAWDRAGNLTRADQCWQQAEQLCTGARPSRQGPDPIYADVLLQQGRLDHLRGHLASALGRFEAALRHAVPGAQALEVRLRQLLVRLDLNQWQQVRSVARPLLDAHPLDGLAEELCPLAAMVRSLLDGEAPAVASDELRAYQAAAAGDVSAARSLYAAALAASPSPERRARLALSLGLLGLNHTNREEARSWLRQAEELARSRDLPEVLARVLLVSGQLAAEEEGEEFARRLFEEALVITEVQAGQLAGVVEGLPYRQQRGSVLRFLLRAACRRGDAVAVFRYQEQERGRLLLGLLQAAAPGADHVPLFHRPEAAELRREIAACQQELRADRPSSTADERRRSLLRKREELLLRQDQLFEEFLRDRDRRGSFVLPPLPELADLQRTLPPGTLYVAPSLVEGELYILATTYKGPAVVFRGEKTNAPSWTGASTTSAGERSARPCLGPSKRAGPDRAGCCGRRTVLCTACRSTPSAGTAATLSRITRCCGPSAAPLTSTRPPPAGSGAARSVRRSWFRRARPSCRGRGGKRKGWPRPSSGAGACRPAPRSADLCVPGWRGPGRSISPATRSSTAVVPCPPACDCPRGRRSTRWNGWTSPSQACRW